MTLTPLPERIYYVGPDDTFEQVAQRVYGNGSQSNQDLIYQANKERFLCNDKTLRQGMTLRIPSLP